jgi:hypothetical protein
MYKDLPITIRRRVTPEQLDIYFSEMLNRSQDLYHWCTTKPDDEKLEAYLKYMINFLVISFIDNTWFDSDEKYSLMFKNFYDALMECYSDELIVEFKRHEKKQWRRPYQ